MVPEKYRGTSLDRLIALVTTSNPALGEWEYGRDFTFGDPYPVTTTNFRNSSIRFKPTDEKYREQDLRYRRLGLEVLRTWDDDFSVVLVDSLPTSTHAILDRINAALGLSLTVNEVEDIQYTTISDRYPLRIKANNVSLAWVYSTYNFKAQLAGRFRITTQGKYRMTGEHRPRAVGELPVEG